MSNQTVDSCDACTEIIESQKRVIDYLRHENSDQGNEITNLNNELATLKHKLQDALLRLKVAYRLYESSIKRDDPNNEHMKENCDVK